MLALLILGMKFDRVVDQLLIHGVFYLVCFGIPLKNICDQLIFFYIMLLVHWLRFKWVLLHVVNHLLLRSRQSFIHNELRPPHILNNLQQIIFFRQFLSTVIISLIQLVVFLYLFAAWLRSSIAAQRAEVCAAKGSNTILGSLETEEFQVLSVTKRQDWFALNGQFEELVCKIFPLDALNIIHWCIIFNLVIIYTCLHRPICSQFLGLRCIVYARCRRHQVMKVYFGIHRKAIHL